MYSSTMSKVHLLAAANALLLNKHSGNNRRWKLFANVTLLKQLLRLPGLHLGGGFFPVQSLAFKDEVAATVACSYLKKHGLETALVKDHAGASCVCFVVRADHKTTDIHLLAVGLKGWLNVVEHGLI